MKLTRLPENVLPVADLSELRDFALRNKLEIHTVDFPGQAGRKSQKWHLVFSNGWFGYPESY